MHRPTSPRPRALAAGLLTLLPALLGGCPERLTYGPILGRGLHGDTMLVKWSTTPSPAPSRVHLRKKGEPAFAAVPATAGREHEALLRDLAPGTVYEYYVETGPERTRPAAFSTCPLPGRPMDFAFYGDSRSGSSDHARIAALIGRHAPDMVFESGDIAPLGMPDEYLGEFFPAVRELAATTPFMAVPGNHDFFGGLSVSYALFFPTPRPPAAPWRPFYTFTCGNVRFVGLNSNDVYDPEQQAFLERTLRRVPFEPTIQHVFVWFHHSAYSPGPHGDSTQVQDSWVPLLNDPSHKVTAVFSGHDHIYARMKDASGVFYVVSGGAGADLYSSNGASAAARVVGRSALNFVMVHVAGAQASFVAYDDKDVEIDRFGATRPAVPVPDGGPPPEEEPGDLGEVEVAGDGGADAAGPAPGVPAGGCAVAGAAAPPGTAGWLAIGLAGLAARARRRSRSA